LQWTDRRDFRVIAERGKGAPVDEDLPAWRFVAQPGR
jgi:hypothetical protein